MFFPLRTPLPPLLARLHAALERWAEAHEEGIVIVEHDRRPPRPPPGGAAPGAAPPDGPVPLPVIVVIPPRPRGEGVAGRVAPDFLAELEQAGVSEDRLRRCARAGVPELWRVTADPAGGPPALVVFTEPAGEGYARARAVAPDEEVAAGALPSFTLRPRDLLAD